MSYDELERELSMLSHAAGWVSYELVPVDYGRKTGLIVRDDKGNVVYTKVFDTPYNPGLLTAGRKPLREDLNIDTSSSTYSERRDIRLPPELRFEDLIGPSVKIPDDLEPIHIPVEPPKHEPKAEKKRPKGAVEEIEERIKRLEKEAKKRKVVGGSLAVGMVKLAWKIMKPFVSFAEKVDKRKNSAGDVDD